jgi:hypothetical protein
VVEQIVAAFRHGCPGAIVVDHDGVATRHQARIEAERRWRKFVTRQCS